MKLSKKIIVGILVIGILFSLAFVSATYSKSSARYTSSYGSSLGLGGMSERADSFCQEGGMDFLIEINPFGCTPAVVRSDLLEEQNVPIFCELSAIQINPLVKVDAIDSITFSGKYPDAVQTVGFHAERAALGTDYDLSQPVMDNVGYVVIVLKKQENASAMPKFVQGNLTAKLRYDIKNAYGIGNVNFYLDEIPDSEWEMRRNEFSFWQGRGYLKADGISNDGATISLYDDTRRITRVNLKKGQTSNMIYLPDFECLAGLQLRLDGLENPDTRAKLNINGEIVEVGEGEKFLENKCYVKHLDKSGLTTEVEIHCTEDDGGFLGSKGHTLKISPKIDVEICDADGSNCEKKTVEVGDFLYKDKSSGRNVYVGYIGQDSSKNKNYFIPIMSTKETSEKALQSVDVKVLTKRYAEMIESKNHVGDSFIKNAKNLIVQTGVMTDAIVQGTDFGNPIFEGEKEDIQFFFDSVVDFSGDKLTVRKAAVSTAASFAVVSFAPVIMVAAIGYAILNPDIKDEFKKLLKEDPEPRKIKFIGIKSPTDTSLADSSSYYEEAKNDYTKVIEDYPNEIYSGFNDKTLGEQAYVGLIKTAFALDQKQTMLDLCEKFKKQFPKSKLFNDVKYKCENTIELSSDSVSSLTAMVNGDLKVIQLLGVNEPGFDDYGVDLEITDPEGFTNHYYFKKDQKISFGPFGVSSTSDYIQLTDLDDDWAKIDYSLVRNHDLKASIDRETKRGVKIEKDKTVGLQSDYQITLRKVNLQKQAKVSVIPNINNVYSESNFSFKVGIEQRTIKLSPEKTKEKLANLNKSIKDWEKRSEDLGDVVQGMKGACLATGLLLTTKNFLTNAMGTTSIARKEVMDGYWKDYCKKQVAEKKYTNIDHCYADKADKIDNSVDLMNKKLEEENEKIKTLEKGITTTKFLTEKYVDTDEFTKRYVNNIDRNELKARLNNLAVDGKIKLNNGDVSVDDFVNNMVNENQNLNDLKEIELYSKFLDSSDPALKAMAEKNLKETIERINQVKKSQAKIESLQKEISESDIYKVVGGKIDVVSVSGEKSIDVAVNPTPLEKDKSIGLLKAGESGSKIGIVNYAGKSYLVKYNKVNEDVNTKKYDVIEVYDTKGSAVDYINLYDENGNKIEDENKLKALINGKYNFKEYNIKSYENNYKSPKIRMYETEPYAGLPALVPITNDGWYASISQVLPTGSTIRSYDDSGRLYNFYLCNVGENGLEENRKYPDDDCREVNLGTNTVYTPFHGLEPKEVQKIIDCAVNTVGDVSRAYAKGLLKGKRYRYKSCGQTIDAEVGAPEVDVPDFQCQEFMSPTDCQILFNVCDPVICPSSRCNLGGAYPVKDVIQSGFIGSIALCFPNFIGMGGDVVIPVCLTGIKAAMDGWLSVMKSYRDCLQESLDTGKMVGICDEVYSLHMCEFLWRQGLPIAKLIIPKSLEILMGQNVQGGGEYLGVQSAWDTASQSMTYFTQYYATNSYKAFKARNMEEFGDDVCKNYVSGVVPNEGSLFDSLTAPDSPSQFHGRFDEIPFTTATNPPISQYKVFYHIYAGKDRGAYFSVYLKGPESSYYQDATLRSVASGYIEKGDYKTETLDFTAPSGFTELCIQVNEQKECGFKEVSTSFALNYVEDKYLASQADNKDIQTEEECVSGKASLYSLVNPNIEGAAQEMIDPQLYNEGIVRICATKNPGEGSNPDNWVEVGYCTDKNIKCWLDMESVNKTIKNLNIKGDLQKQNEEAQKALIGDEYLTEAEFKTKVGEIIDSELKGEDKFNVIKMISTTLGKSFYNYQKAYLLYLRAGVYAEQAKQIYEKKKAEEAAALAAKKAAETLKKLQELGEAVYDDGDYESGGDNVGGEKSEGGDNVGGKESGKDKGIILYSPGGSFEDQNLRIDEDFKNSINEINKCASANSLKIIVMDSFRVDNGKPANNKYSYAPHSNHFVGHAIDFNLILNGQILNSDYLNNKNKDNWASEVGDFIACIKNADLRWGGDFDPSDPVHIDDGLYQTNLNLWNEKYFLMQGVKKEEKEKQTRFGNFVDGVKSFLGMGGGEEIPVSNLNDEESKKLIKDSIDYINSLIKKYGNERVYSQVEDPQFEKRMMALVYGGVFSQQEFEDINGGSWYDFNTPENLNSINWRLKEKYKDYVGEVRSVAITQEDQYLKLLVRSNCKDKIEYNILKKSVGEDEVIFSGSINPNSKSDDTLINILLDLDKFKTGNKYIAVVACDLDYAPIYKTDYVKIEEFKLFKTTPGKISFTSEDYNLILKIDGAHCNPYDKFDKGIIYYRIYKNGLINDLLESKSKVLDNSGNVEIIFGVGYGVNSPDWLEAEKKYYAEVSCYKDFKDSRETDVVEFTPLEN